MNNKLALALIVAFLLPLFACKNDGNPTGVQPRQTTEVTLENAWPDDDGNQWTYDVRMFDAPAPAEAPLFATRDEVPAMPALDEIEAQLPDLSRPGGPLDEAYYSLRFNGRGTTYSGAEGKLLEGRFGDGAWFSKGVDPFLARLAAYRPDLFTSDERKEECVREFAPIFISNGIWRRTPDAISFLNDVDQEARFRILESNVRAGHEWSIQTIPSLSSDVFLHVRVLGLSSNKSVPSMGLQSGDVLRVLYAFDMGVAQMRTPLGEAGEYFRAILYGVVDYEAEVGPSFFREFHLVYLDKDLDGNTIFLDPQAEYEGWLSD